MPTNHRDDAQRVADLLERVEDTRLEIVSAFRNAYTGLEITPDDRSLEDVAQRVNVLLELAALYVGVLDGLESDCDDLADALTLDDDYGDFSRCSTPGCGEIFSNDDLDSAGRCPICVERTGRDLPAAEPIEMLEGLEDIARRL